ncbi:MAG: HEAT repeat domain-containing protein, partial [Chloroflexota bacterium]
MANPDLKQLLAELRDFNKERRRKAVYKLGMLGGEEALRALMVAVEDENEDTIVRGRAAQMLGKMRDTRAVTPLISALQAKGYQTPIHAAQALGHIGDKRAIIPLIKLRNQNDNEGAQKAAAAALAKLGYDAPQSE